MPFVITIAPSRPGSPKPERPHFAFPFGRTADGTGIRVVEQDSDEHIMSCALMVARTPLGYRQERPEFGWDWPDLRLMPVDASGLVNALNAFEPRASSVLSTDDIQQIADASLGVQNITVNVRTPTSDGTGQIEEDD